MPVASAKGIARWELGGECCGLLWSQYLHSIDMYAVVSPRVQIIYRVCYSACSLVWPIWTYIIAGGWWDGCERLRKPETQS